MTQSELKHWWQKHCLIHTVFALLIASNFLLLSPDPLFNTLIPQKQNLFVGIMLFATLIGYMGLITSIPFWVARCFFKFPKAPQWIPITTVILASISIFLLIIDLEIYRLLRLHLVGVVWQFIWEERSGNNLGLSDYEKRLVVGVFFIILTGEYSIYRIITRYFSQQPLKYISGLGYGLAGNLIFSTIAFLLAACNLSTETPNYLRDYQITHNARVFPFYTQFISLVLGSSRTTTQVETWGAATYSRLWQPNLAVHYPLKPLQCKPSEPKNIVMIIIDTWRYDMVTQLETPNIWQYTQHAYQFRHHFSGGNATIPGFFSLFFSVPPNYVRPFEQQNIQPVLMQELKKLGYQTTVFAGDSIQSPHLDKLIFSLSDKIYALFDTDKLASDVQAIKKFEQFLQSKHERPFFAVLYLAGVHNFCVENKILTPFLPCAEACNRSVTIKSSADITSLKNRYRNTLYSLDTNLKFVLETLHHQYKDNTAVVITGDHGEEFADTSLHTWGHANAYTTYQTKTPLIVSAPHLAVGHSDKFTSHYNIVPWLLSDILGCRNPTRDYSVGASLFSLRTDPTFIIQGSYIDLALRTPKQTTVVYPSGLFEVLDAEYHAIPGAKLDAALLTEAYQQMKLYYQ